MLTCELGGPVEAYVRHVAEIARTTPTWSATWQGAGALGFPVQLAITDRLWGDFGGLLSDFDDLATALVWVRRAGSPQWCLRIDVIAGRPRAWSLEPWGWTAGHSVRLASGHLGLFDRFRRRTSLVLCNRKDPPAKAGEPRSGRPIEG